jgi:hypothetical protein
MGEGKGSGGIKSISVTYKAYYTEGSYLSLSCKHGSRGLIESNKMQLNDREEHTERKRHKRENETI